ncbi:taste receptor type 2 member 105-like [Pogona vitticeps]
MVAEIMHQYVIVTWMIVAISCSFALLGNGFIIVVKGYQWFQQRKMIPSDFLLTCLSSSRVLTLWTGGLAFILGIAASETYKHTRTEEFLNFSSFFFDIISICLSAVSTILLITSLWRHITNLRKTGAGMKDVSTQVHINVMKPLVFYLFCYLSYFMAFHKLQQFLHFH